MAALFQLLAGEFYQLDPQRWFPLLPEPGVGVPLVAEFLYLLRCGVTEFAESYGDLLHFLRSPPVT